MGVGAAKEAPAEEWPESALEVIQGYLDEVFDATTAFQHQESEKRWSDDALRGTMFGIDGLISGGKTTLGKSLARLLGPNASFQEEEVDPVWLDLFYSDKARHASTFQVNQLGICVAASKVTAERCRHGAIGIVDRTPLGNFCFAALHLIKGNIAPATFECYLSTLIRSGPYLYSDVLFLLVDPGEAKKRVDARVVERDDRDSEEEGVDLRYLRELNHVMLFVSLYARARGVLRVAFVSWDKFGPTRGIIAKVLKARAADPQPNNNLRKRILAADYQGLVTIASELCVDLTSE